MFSRLSFVPFPLAARRHLSTSPVQWAGHNKWSKIKQKVFLVRHLTSNSPDTTKKGANDASKSAAFQRATQDILVAARSGGVDPDKNAALAAVLKRLKAQDVPNHNIEKALAKAVKVKSSGEISTYEAIACNSVGIMIECATDNPNRTAQTLREILNSRNARMAPVGFMFVRGGRIVIGVQNNPDADALLDAVTELALSHGAEGYDTVPPLTKNDSQLQMNFCCQPLALSKLTNELKKRSGVYILESQLVHYPVTKTELPDEDTEILEDLVHALEAHDDVIRVTTSATQIIPGSIIATSNIDGQV
ncbi:transcriptional regulator-domain-containing protein [Lentinula guzmanii]|uniref:Transcriptional regulator-domain-containing protein n=1 Tax=Lentinula guzmanii TaxID=2804957 RepID=A0AA38MWZ0_9AGAR|nr:transcriptional regulator-domain-containing protein [Lentinula guzmanii]